MKKFMLLASCFILLISFQTVKGSSVENEVEITYVENSITTTVRSSQNDRTVFDIYYNNLNNLTGAQLKELLDQEMSSDYLTITGSINIKIIPNSQGDYKDLLNKTNMYIGNQGGIWENPLTVNIEPDDTAKKTTLSTNENHNLLYVYYRKEITDPWIRDTADLSGSLTIEEQLAELLTIDLGTNQNGIVDLYKTNYYFKPFAEGYVYTDRYDFYTDLEEATPIQEESNIYNTNQLKHLGTEYVLMRYHGETEATFNEQTSRPLYFISITTLAGFGLFLYFFKNKIKQL